jgi:hypothetical protein
MRFCELLVGDLVKERDLVADTRCSYLVLSRRELSVTLDEAYVEFTLLNCDNNTVIIAARKSDDGYSDGFHWLVLRQGRVYSRRGNTFGAA